MSPFSFAMDNPLHFNDPTGRIANDVNIKGDQKVKAVVELNKRTAGQLVVTEKDGKLSYTKVEGAKIDKDVQKLINAIDDHSVVVNVDATDKPTTPDGRLVVGGGFLGNQLSTAEDGTQTVVANQQIDPDVLRRADSYVDQPGANSLHEITEAYEGANLAKTLGYSIPGGESWMYKAAHYNASPQPAVIKEHRYDRYGGEVFWMNKYVVTEVYTASGEGKPEIPIVIIPFNQSGNPFK